MAEAKKQVVVGIVMGSKSDWPTMEAAAKVLDELGIAYEAEVMSAHRSAGAGGAAHLAGFLAAKTSLPVLGVPMKSSALNGLDSLLSIVQMPAGIPVATFAIGEAGAKNAGLFAASILALGDKAIAQQLEKFRSKQTETVLKGSDPRA